MINVHAQPKAQTQTLTAPVVVPGARFFWALFAAIGVAVALAVALVLAALPTQTPLVRGGDVQLVRDAVWARINGEVADPLVVLAPGITVRQSNVRGFAIGGQTYYYFFAGQPGYDPLSQGAVSAEQIEIVARDSAGPATLTIYRIR